MATTNCHQDRSKTPLNIFLSVRVAKSPGRYRPVAEAHSIQGGLLQNYYKEIIAKYKAVILREDDTDAAQASVRSDLAQQQVSQGIDVAPPPRLQPGSSDRLGDLRGSVKLLPGP